MRFEPRLFDDDAGEEDLPDDLRLLVEQLSDDAEHLQRLYPAKLVEPVLEIRSSRPRLRLTVAAAALIAAVGLGSSWLLSQTAPPQIAARPGTLKNGSAPQIVSHEPAQPAARPSEPVNNSTSPVTMFGDLTGPEQEALLDLLEENAQAAPSLSI